MTPSAPPPRIDTARKAGFLERPDAYPEGTTAVEVEETHMSWVFLTDRHVYKMKKPVRFDYLDFSTLDRRRRDCEAEVKLNRRLAGEVYRGVVALCLDAGGALRLDGPGEPVEWLVKMLRLPRERMLDQAIAGDRVDRQDVHRFTSALAAFYRRTDPEPVGAEAYVQRFRDDIGVMAAELSEPGYRLPAELPRRLGAALLRFVSAHRGQLEARAEAGRIVEAHGDLRPQHVCLTDPPVFIDCLEFDRSLRLLDPVDELSFLAMECELAGAPFVGDTLFATYREETGDGPAPSLIHFYKASRALLRAQLSVWHVKDHARDEHEKWIGKARDYLKLATAHTGMLPTG